MGCRGIEVRGLLGCLPARAPHLSQQSISGASAATVVLPEAKSFAGFCLSVSLPDPHGCHPLTKLSCPLWAGSKPGAPGRPELRSPWVSVPCLVGRKHLKQMSSSALQRGRHCSCFCGACSPFAPQALPTPPSSISSPVESTCAPGWSLSPRSPTSGTWDLACLSFCLSLGFLILKLAE